jgi:hypothetical protein
LPSSPFQGAEPKIPVNSFLVSIDGVKLDRYGQGTKKEFVDYKVDFSDLMMMRGGTGEEDVNFETCDAATGKVQKHKTSLTWSKDREGKGVQYVWDPRLDKFEWEIFGDLLFMPLTENTIDLFIGDYDVDASIRFLEPQERQKPRLAVLLLKEGGEASEALSLSKGSDLEIVESINGHEVKDLEDFRRHFFPTQARKAAALISSNLSRHSREDDGSAPGSQSFLRRDRKALRNGEELVWSLKTTAGREFASLFVETLTRQAGQYNQGALYMMTSAAKDAMRKLGLLGNSANLLVKPQRELPSEMDIDAVSDVRAQPLEVVRRDGGVAVLEFAPHEGYDSW